MHFKEDDIVIIQDILRGNTAAYSKLVEHYKNYVFSIILKIVNEREVAEELAQDVFIKAYRSLADFKGNSKFSTWLYAIANTTTLSYLRKKKNPIVWMEEMPENIAYTNTASHLLENKTQKQLLQDAIQQLTPIDAQIISLFYMNECSLDDIARILGQDINNVKVKLFRARQKLKDILQSGRYAKELDKHHFSINH